MEESGKNSSTNMSSATKAKRKAENAEETNRKRKRARGIRNEAESASGGTVTSNNGDHTAVTTSLLELPVLVLIKIIKMLPMAQWASLEIVNGHFQRAAFEAWRSVRKIHLDEDLVFNREGVKKNDNSVLECLLEKLVLRSPNINEITGFECVGFPGMFTDMDHLQRRSQCFRLLGQFKSLERISFAEWQEYNDDVVSFLSQSDNRENFKEVDISRMGAWVDRRIPTARGNDYLKLEKFWCRRSFSSDALNLVGVSLTTLSITETSVDPEDLFAFINRNDRLERLDFSVGWSNYVSEAHEEKSFLAHKQLFSAISTLTSKSLSVLKIGHRRLAFWRRLESEVVHLLEEFGRHHRLKKLSLTKWDSCTTRVVDAIVDNLTDLTSLSMAISKYHCSTASLINLMKKLTRLQKLKLISDKALDGAVVTVAAANLIGLESLSLVCDFLPPVDLGNLGLLTNLKRLRVDSRVDDADLRAWSDGFGSKLESLRLKSAPAREGGFSTLVKEASKLRHLDLSSACIVDDHLRLIASSCRLLREFYAGQGDFTEGVQAIIDGCSQLKWLEIGVPSGRFWRGEPWNVGKYRKINFCKRPKKAAPFGKDG